jgi:BirA family biotin operon repressor/biotin-[acetyl-CoA-carboxylase] ligase
VGEAATPTIRRVERHADTVRARLEAGEAEIAVAVADLQTAGRGREGRSWVAPAGRALLCSLGFRPTWLASPADAWRLAAVAALAMADAAEETAGLRDGTVRLKWPNDLVVEPPDGGAGLPRKLGGTLGETVGLGSGDPLAIVGVGVNADWPALEFPRELATTMTSLREASGGRPVDREALLDAFLGRLELRVAALAAGRFDGGGWAARQLTSGRLVRLELPDGSSATVRAAGVDPATGALLVEDGEGGRERPVTVGEIVHLRLEAGGVPSGAGV